MGSRCCLPDWKSLCNLGRWKRFPLQLWRQQYEVQDKRCIPGYTASVPEAAPARIAVGMSWSACSFSCLFQSPLIQDTQLVSPIFERRFAPTHEEKYVAIVSTVVETSSRWPCLACMASHCGV